MRLPEFAPSSRKLHKTRPYMRGTDVRYVQQFLKWFGLYHGKVDGIFGPETENAVKRFQSFIKIKPAGVADEKLFEILQKMIKGGAGEWVTLKKDFYHSAYSPVLLSGDLEATKLLKVKEPVALVAKRNVVFTADESYIGAFDLKSGKFMWKSEKITPFSISLASDRVLVSASDLVAVDALSGKTSFKVDGDVFDAPAVAHGGVIYASSRSGAVYALNHRGEMLWRFGTRTNHITPLACALGFLYFGSISYVCCLDEKGTIYWKTRLPGLIKEPLSVYENKVFAVSGEGSIFTLDAIKGKMIWKRNFGEAILAPCFLGESVIIVTTGGKVISLDTEDGRVNWQEDVNATPATPPLACADAIFIGTDAGLVVLKPNGVKIKTYFEGKRISHVIQARLGLIVAAEGFLWELSPLELK
ncbi:MAG: hypothetical protein PWP45_563 [Tepidanaerobacteraceae bacterium]|nr:hypothetical protein [Tepidanaerobacteraceae bacterium]